MGLAFFELKYLAGRMSPDVIVTGNGRHILRKRDEIYFEGNKKYC